MANNGDKFILEIAAQLKNDGGQLAQTIAKEIKKIENKHKLNLSVNDDKLTQYIEKLKKSLNEINATMNNSNLEMQSTSFVKFVDVLKEGAQYSKTIADSLQKASNIKINLDNLKQQVKAYTGTVDVSKLSDTGKANRNSYITEMKQMLGNVQRIKNEVGHIKMPNSFEKALKDVEQLSRKKINFENFGQLGTQLNNMRSLLSEIQKIANQSTNAYNSAIADRNATLDSKYKQYNSLKLNENLYGTNDNYASQIDKYKAKLMEYKTALDGIRSSNDTTFNSSSLKPMEQELNNMLKILNHPSFKKPIDVLPQTATIEQATKKLEQLAAQEEGLTLKGQSINQLDNGMVKLTATYQNANGEIKKVVYAYNDTTKAITKLSASTKTASSSAQQMGQSFSGSLKSLMAFTSSYFGVTRVFTMMREGAQIVRELDTALTEMQKVSNESLSSLQKYASNTFDVARDIGTTGLALQNSTGDWMRLGKSMDDASKLAKDTSILMNVSEFSNIDAATESMVSMTQAYQELSSGEIVDKLNLTGNNYSISTDELAQSLQKSASALKTAKNDFDEAIALTVAGNSVVQNPDSVAAGIRTISLRMTGTSVAKEELESLGESTDDFLTKSKLNDTLEKLTAIDERGGISLLDANGNYRSTAQVLIDLADRWEEIGQQDIADGENRQNALLEALAGKNRSNILASILNDKDLLKTVYEDVSANYDGSALKENEKYMNSIEGHITQLTNEWQDFLASDANREFANDLIDLVKGFVELIDVIGGAKNALLLFVGIFAQMNSQAVTLGIGALINSFKEIITTGRLASMEKTISDSFKNMFKLNIGDDIADETIEGVTDAISGEITENVAEGVTNGIVDGATEGVASGAIEGLTDGVSSGISEGVTEGLTSGSVEGAIEGLVDGVSSGISEGVTEGLTSGLTSSAVEGTIEGTIEGGASNISRAATQSGGGAVAGIAGATGRGALSNMLSFAGTPLGIAAIVAAVAGAGIFAYNKYQKSLEEAKERAENAIDDYKNVQKELSTIKGSLPDLAIEYDTLKQGVSSTGQNLSLTNDEFQRYNEITNEIASKFPSLIDGYTSTGNAIINMSDAVNELNNAYDNEAQKKAKENMKDSSLKDQKKSIKLTKDDNKKNVKELLKNSNISSDNVKELFLGVDYGSKNKIELEEILKKLYNEKNIIDNNNIRKTLKSLNIQGDAGYGADRAEMFSNFSSLSKSLAFDKKSYDNIIKKLELNADDSEIYDNFISYLQDSVAAYEEQYNDMKSRMVTFSQSKLKYYDLNESQRSNFDSIIMNLSESDYNTYSESEESLTKFLNNYVSYVEDNEETISSLSNLSDIYNSDLTLAEANKKVNELKSKMSKGVGLTDKTMDNWLNLDDYNYEEITNNIASFFDKMPDEIKPEIIEKQKKYFEQQSGKLLEESYKIADEIGENEYYRGTNAGVVNGTKYGNIDLNDRQVLKWTKSNIKKYKKNLESIGEKDLASLLGSESTVLGASGNYEGVEIAYSPMLQTEDGAELLNQKTLDKYLSSLVKKANKDGKVGTKELLKLDSKGLEIDGKKIKGLIADVGSTAKRTAEAMHYFGENGSLHKTLEQMDKFNELSKEIPVFGDISIEQLQETFSPTELQKINDNMSHFQDAMLTNWNEEFYKYYDSWTDYVLQCMEFVSESNPFYLGENKSFAQLNDDSSSYSSTLAQLNYVGNENVKITDEMAETIKSYGDEFSQFVNKKGNDYIITNTKSLKELIKTKQKDMVVDARASRDTAINEYVKTTDSLIELSNQLEDTAYFEGYLSDSILDNIDSTQEQLVAIERNIQKYQQLEQQLIGTTNAFDVYNEAVKADELNNKYASASSMMETLKHGLNTGQMGTEAFKAGIQGILSDEEYDELLSIEDLEKRVSTMKSKYESLRKYFKTDDDGNISTDSIQNFIDDGYSKGLFTSNNLDKFEVSDNIGMDDFVNKLGYSEEIIYSIFEMIQTFNVDWGNNLFKGLTDDTNFGKTGLEIQEATDKINEYINKKNEALIKRDGVKKNSKEWNELGQTIEKCNNEIKKYKDKQDTSTNKYITDTKEYLKNQQEIEKIQLKIDTALNSDGEINIDIAKADEKLGKLLARQKKLGEPTEIQLTLIKDEYEKELEKKRQEKLEIEAEIKATIKEPNIKDTLAPNGQGVLTQVEYELEKNSLTKEVDDEIAALEKNIKDINVALNVTAEKDETYQPTVNDVNADKAEMEKDCETPSISLDSTPFTKKANEVKDVKSKLSENTNSTHFQYTKYISLGGDEDSDAIGKNNKIISSPNKGTKFTAIEKSNMLVTGIVGGISAFGNAFSIGSNSTNYSSGKTLVGEFGAETIVDPWSGRYKVVGTHGSEMINIPKDAIVYNHKQTEQLLKNNKINSRGKLITDASGYMKNFAKASPMQGNAFATVKKPTTSDADDSKKKKDKSSNSDKNNSKSLIDNLFDWIEIRLQRLSNKTQKWITLAENAISKNVKKSHYTSAISGTSSELSQNQTAYSKYMAQANALIKKSGVKNASAYAKKVREGTLNLQTITNEKTLDFINSYKEMYEKAVDCNNAVMDLTGELQNLAESLYNLPIEYAEKKIEKYSDKMDVLSAKYENYRSHTTQNPNLDEQTKLQKSIKNAYASAYSETKSNLSSAKGKINSTSDKALKGLSSAQKKKIVSYVKDGKEINIANSYSATLKKAIANYNAALEANRVAANESAKASAEYTKVLRENTNAKYENITAYYEQNRSLNDARLSKLDAKLSYRESMGYSAVSTHSTGQKAVYDEMIKYNQDILKQLRTERDFYNADTLKKQYDNGELSREDYYALLSRIQEIDEAIYTTTTAINEARDEIYNLNIKRLDIVIDSVSKAIEKFKNIISLKESRNEDVSESYYTSQNSGLIQQIETLNSKREAILEEMKYYAVNSNKYQELATELQSAESDIYSKLTELEENKNAIMELRFKPLSDSIGSLDEQIDDLEHLRDLLSDDELINDKGFFTESGLADISLIAKSIDNTKQKIADYRYALEALEENFKSGNLSQVEFTEQSREYIEAIQSSTKAIEDYKDALIDLYTQQLEIENDALQESITKRKEALQAKKDYYNYDKSLKESNKDIVNLKNQIAALEGVNNASAKAEVERLRAQLSEAESELDDTKYDHGVQLQLDGYDEMSESADKILEDLLEDLKTNAQLQEQVVSDMLNNIVNNYDIAYSKIKEIINSTAVNNSTANSLNTTGGNIASSSTTSPNDRSSSYGNISSSTITSGNANTSKIESTISNSTLNQTNRKVAKITPSLSSVSMEAGKTKTVTCTVQPSDAANTSLSVSSSNTKVATATVSGTTITITGKTAGSCTIVITAKDGSGISASVTASVTAAPAKTTTTSTKTTTSSSASKSTTSTSKKTSSSSSSKKTTSTKKSTAGYVSGISATISKSSSASNIKKVQTALKALGFKGKDGKALTIDGKWGTNTDYAVKNFQKSTKYGGKIKADGIIGKNTKAKFKKAGYFKGGIVDNVINNSEFLEMIRMNRDDGLITAKLGEGIIPKNMMPDFTKQLEQFNSIPADKLINSISNNNPNLNIHIDKFMDVQGNVDKNCVNDLRNLQNDITNNITRTLTQEFRKLGYK